MTIKEQLSPHIAKIKAAQSEIDTQMEAINGAMIMIDAVISANERGEFLADLSANDGQYEVSFMAEAAKEPTPEILTPEEIEAATTPTEQKPLVEKVVQVLEMEKTGETPLLPAIEGEQWEKLCALVLSGYESPQTGKWVDNISPASVQNTCISKGVSTTTKQVEYLAELRKLKAQFLAKDLDLNQALGQVQSEAEKTALRGLATKHNLK